jgi:Enolase C-terminal domain-like/Beta-lactamase enzyme family
MKLEDAGKDRIAQRQRRGRGREEVMQRRTLFSLAAASAVLAASAVTDTVPAAADDDGGSGEQQHTSGDLGVALRRYLALPGTKSYMIHVGQGGSLGRITHRPDLFLFTASAYKTFVLGQYLRDVEAGRLAEDEPLAIDDSVRMISSPAFIELAGTTEARVVLEAMIAHSDNTATDRATSEVGADRVQMKACDYVMPDFMRIGGVTGWQRAAAIAAAAGIPISTHLYPEVAAQLMRVTETAHWLEWQDWANPILQQPYELKGGELHIPDVQGVGLEWDEKAIAAHLADNF